MQEYARLHHPGDPAAAFHYLIALVPDPEESGHTDYFDAVLEGVEEAALAGSVDVGETAKPRTLHRYLRDRHWLPWSRSDKTKRDSKCWERVPGVILYRPSEGAGQRPALAVLVVGENPTWGVHADVLEAALECADQASCASGSGQLSASLHLHRILGPTFSGTAPGLRAAIDRHIQLARALGGSQLPVTLQIASGTATGDSVKATLEDGKSGADASITYRSAVPTFSRLLTTMVAFLDKADGGGSANGSSVAVLSESGTAYGEQSRKNSGEEQSSAAQILHYRFPPNLSSLRKAYAAAPTGGPSGEQSVTRAPSGSNITPAEAQGELSEQSAIAHDLALAEVLGECSQQQVRNVGIVATAASDVIFIAQRVGRQLPDVRLFTIGDDIRYLHPDHVSVLNGMLVAHAAPPPSREGGSSTVTKNPMTQHVAAAGQFLLADRALEPLARVSLIGNGSLRQIADDVDAEGRERTFTPKAPRSFRMVCLLTLLVLIVVLALLIGPRLAAARSHPAVPENLRSSPFLRQRSALWSWFHQIDYKDLAADDTFATATLVSVVASALLMTSSTLIRASHLAPSAQSVLPLLLGVLLVVVWRPCFSLGRKASPSAIVLGITMSALAFIATSLGCSPLREVTLWLLSGASPLIGGLLGMGMLLVVAWCWRARLRSLDLLCFGAQRNTSFAGLADEPPLAQVLGYRKGKPEQEIVREYEKHFLTLLRSPWGAAPLIVVGLNAALLASILLVNILKPVLTFEAGFRHWVLFGVGVASVLPITTSFARMSVTSQALLQLLRAIASPALLTALGHLPSELAQRLETQLVRGGRHSGELKHPVQALLNLAHVEPTSKDAAKKCAQLLDEQLRYEAGLPASDEQVYPADLVDELLLEANRLSNKSDFHAPEGLALAMDFRACLTTILVGRYVREMRSLIPPVVLGCALAILMTSLYFVQPRHLIATACFMWVTAIVLAIVAIYILLARDPLLSAIGKTDAGETNLSWGLATRVGGVTVVPLAGLIASQYPEFAFWVTSLLGSVTQFVQ